MWPIFSISRGGKGLATKAVEVLRDPAAFRPLGRAGEALIAREYSLDVVLPRMVQFHQEVLGRNGA